jgi:hypothetical protein
LQAVVVVASTMAVEAVLVDCCFNRLVLSLSEQVLRSRLVLAVLVEHLPHPKIMAAILFCLVQLQMVVALERLKRLAQIPEVRVVEQDGLLIQLLLEQQQRKPILMA